MLFLTPASLCCYLLRSSPRRIHLACQDSTCCPSCSVISLKRPLSLSVNDPICAGSLPTITMSSAYTYTSIMVSPAIFENRHVSTSERTNPLPIKTTQRSVQFYHNRPVVLQKLVKCVRLTIALGFSLDDVYDTAGDSRELRFLESGI